MTDDTTIAKTEATVRDFFRGWLADTDWFDAIELLEMLPTRDTDTLVIALSRAVHAHPALNGSEIQAMALVVVLLNGQAIDTSIDPDDAEMVTAAADDILEECLRGFFHTRQQAAFAAVRQLGTAGPFGVDVSVETELGDTARTASDTTLDLVEKVAAERHGWYIRHDDRLGWALFRTADNSPS